ncbi:MAG: hydrogenase nickel incorporation protein HypB [Pseudobutyrivibrio sp.]|nr:hydrogenase nickel incorporation protein HypB [Pseudobutyrivibrio sp.]
MSEVRVIKIEESIFASNDKKAEEIREHMTNNGTFFVNVMSGPGAGKTTTLSALINLMKDKYKIGEMDVDIETSIDAQRVADATGIESLQIHNGGLCHIDADMTYRAFEEYDTTGFDLMILENIGNMVCPAEFDTGAHKNIMLLSIPEGDDKPLKYPLMFSVSDLVLINKIDTKEYFDFDFDAAKERILRLNPAAVIIPISAKTGEGLDQVVAWFDAEISKIKGV